LDSRLHIAQCLSIQIYEVSGTFNGWIWVDKLIRTNAFEHLMLLQFKPFFDVIDITAFDVREAFLNFFVVPVVP
jgi:hypothetical protein